MGTIIVNEYLRVADIPVSKVVFDGYVADPKSWNDKLAGKGKQVIKTFDCEHISGFFRYPEEYNTAIVDFLK